MSEHVVEIDIDRRGRGSIKIDGADLSDMTNAVSFEGTHNNRPTVVLTLVPEALKVRVVGDVLAVVPLEPTDG